MAKVYPVGYSRLGSEQYVEKLMSNPTMRLIDTRYKAHSWRREWCAETLRAKYGEQYRQAGAYLGNLNYQNRWPIRLVDPEIGIRGLVQYLREGHDLILLCQCVAYDDCHRKVIIEQLKEAVPEIEVIMPEQRTLTEVKR
jgi:hypothetical protein